MNDLHRHSDSRHSHRHRHRKGEKGTERAVSKFDKWTDISKMAESYFSV